jgi:charged multivesicular body protein 3
MDSFKAVFFKPDPKEQKRKCDTLIRQNKREIDRSVMKMRNSTTKTKADIRSMAKRMQNNPAQAKEMRKSIRMLGKEIANLDKHEKRLNTNKAQLESIQMQVNEAFAVRKIEGSLKASTKVMRDVNMLTKLPELTSTMQLLSQELMKAGIIEEMVGDMLPDDELLGEEEETEAEINKAIRDALGDKESAKLLGQTEEAFPEAPDQIEEEPDTQISENDLAQMRMKLEALKS